LDTNDLANFPVHRCITAELYGGGPELRLRQEAVLGIGGWRLLRVLGFKPEVCHLNEGHTAFAVLERARSFMDDYQQPFDVALGVTRAGNLFTTHTPVDTGFDRFSLDVMKKYFEWYAKERLRISLNDLLALGRKNPSDDSEPFNMAYLAIRGSGTVSRRLFQKLFPTLAGNGSPGRTCHQRGSRPDLGFGRGGLAVGKGLRRRALARFAGACRGADTPRRRYRAVGTALHSVEIVG
jgi:starch phosphorylase